jgi:hypothetical protein
MVALRSRRQDRGLIVALWVLTLPVIGLGIAVVNPILIFWGALGVSAAAFLTRIHVRDTRARSSAEAGGASGGGASRGGDIDGVDGVEKVEEESSR